MKNYILILSILFFSSASFAQAEKIKAQINILGRYQQGKVQLRFLPDKKKVFYVGLKNGFVIQRALLEGHPEDISELDFKTIGKTRAYTPEQWRQAIRNAKGETKDLLELAKDFYDQMDDKKGTSFSLDEGIKELKEAKSKEDFEYMIFAMSALKDAAVAKAIGISFEDPNVISQKVYLYRIALAQNNTEYQVESDIFSIQAVEEPFEERLITIKEGERKLSFQWEEKDIVSGVIAERKDPQTHQWITLNETPIYNLGDGFVNTFQDTNLVNYQVYEYRFYGFTPFGEKVKFGEAKGMPRDLTPPQAPIFVKAKHAKQKEVHLEWKLLKPMEGDFKGFVIGRSPTNKGNFEIISNGVLPKGSRSFVDTTFVTHHPNYYVVQAVDTAGNYSSTPPYFVTLIDSVPPAKPKFVSGKIDSNGVVTVTIELNKEEDLMGYRLFRANGSEHEFSVIREGFDPTDSIIRPVQLVFYDTVTLNSLTPYIYYRTKALDYNFNQSVFSDILKVKRPDTIAPVTPVFKKVLVGTDQVELHFAPSSSRDVVSHFLYRRTDNNQPWRILANIPKGSKKYIDKKVKQKVKYYYSLRAKDDSDLYSDYAFPVAARPYDNGVRPVVNNLKINKLEQEFQLTWTYPSKYKDAVFIIYKKDEKGRLRRLMSTKNKQAKIKKNLAGSSFAVKVFTHDGGESKVSPVVVFKGS